MQKVSSIVVLLFAVVGLAVPRVSAGTCDTFNCYDVQILFFWVQSDGTVTIRVDTSNVANLTCDSGPHNDLSLMSSHAAYEPIYAFLLTRFQTNAPMSKVGLNQDTSACAIQFVMATQ